MYCISYWNINSDHVLQIYCNFLSSVFTFYHATLLWTWSNRNGLWFGHKPKRNTSLEASFDCYILLLLLFVWHWKNLPANGKFELAVQSFGGIKFYFLIRYFLYDKFGFILGVYLRTLWTIGAFSWWSSCYGSIL